jgi:hypothetical protein
MDARGLDTSRMTVIKDCPDDDCPAFLIDDASATAYVVGADPITGEERPVGMPLDTLRAISGRFLQA